MLKSLNILTALACEATPLIESFQLSKVQDRPFGLYHASAEFEVNLIVAGIGETNMATAVGWLAAHSARHDCVWLNIGTAGHADEAVGEFGLVHQVRHDTEARSHFPPLVADWRGKTFALTSFSAACTNYPSGQAVDMEASAFFKSALKFDCAERVQAIKVISDNPANGIEQVNAAQITALIRPAVAEINRFARNLLELLPAITIQPQFKERMAGRHCTTAQRHQFADLVQKAQALAISEQQINHLIEPGIPMAQILKKLGALLDSSPPRLS